MLHIARNPELTGLANMVRDVVYAVHEGRELRMDLLIPQIPAGKEDVRFPAIVFTQGSAWHKVDRNTNIPQLSRFAQAGFVVATIEIRGIEEGYPAPAYLIDGKTAVRFLRHNADLYHVDTEHVFSMGTSSGGHLALLLALTGDNPKYRSGEYDEVSDAVQGTAEAFGTADMVWRAAIEEAKPKDPNGKPVMTDLFCGGVRNDDLLREMSPLYRVEEGKTYPPIFAAHGDADHVVPFEMTCKLVDRLTEVGAQVSFVCVDGADHEGSFWSPQMFDLMLQFLKKQCSGLD